jgi:uncharacterized membrane protein YedE/YeeE
MAVHLSMLLAGLIFGFGLALSGMTHATKVLGFLDVTGNWDPSLLLVMGGAVAVTAIAFSFVLRRRAPVLVKEFNLPTARRVDAPLIVGAALFGIGWGIGGYCPGPGVALLAAHGWETWVFLPSMLLGMLLHRAFRSSPGGSATRPAVAPEN